MASTFSSGTTHLDRKSLKRPDGFMTALREFFGGIAEHYQGFLLVIGGLFAVGLMAGFYLNHRDNVASRSRDELFDADKILASELKSIADQMQPKPVPRKTNAVTPEAPKVTPESITYQKFDVDLKLPGAVQKFKAVIEKYSGARSSYDAAIVLGDLYFNHGEYAKAPQWYEKAVSLAPNTLEKALALSSLGYAYENLTQPAKALEFYQKALNLGEAALKGDLLLAVARCYEATHDSTKARGTYDQILTDLQNTEYARVAELYRSQL